MSVSRVAIGILTTCLAGTCLAEKGTAAAAPTPATASGTGTLEDCWVDHAQVQPAPAQRAGVREPEARAKARLLAEKRVGAEHPPKGVPACSSLPVRPPERPEMPRVDMLPAGR